MIRGLVERGGMKRPAYPSDLSDREWQLLEPLLGTAQTGRPTHHLPPAGDRQRHPLRAAHWVLLADARPAAVAHGVPWNFRTWRRDGTWQRVHGVLHAELRQAQGRQASPSAAIIDSQSVKTTEKGGLGAARSGC